MQQNKALVIRQNDVYVILIFIIIARKAALAMLVDEETEFLATIDRYKTEAHKYNKELSVQRFLERIAQPKKWKYKDGSTTEME